MPNFQAIYQLFLFNPKKEHGMNHSLRALYINAYWY